MEHLARETLVEQLAALPESERRAVIRDADERARHATASSRRTLPWTALRAVVGLVHGTPADAVEDCDRLYDG